MCGVSKKPSSLKKMKHEFSVCIYIKEYTLLISHNLHGSVVGLTIQYMILWISKEKKNWMRFKRAECKYIICDNILYGHKKLYCLLHYIVSINLIAKFSNTCVYHVVIIWSVVILTWNYNYVLTDILSLSSPRQSNEIY